MHFRFRLAVLGKIQSSMSNSPRALAKATLLGGLFFLASHAAGFAADIPKETNTQVAREFYEEVFNQKDTAAISRFLGKVYIQHNPGVPDGPAGLTKAVEQLRAKFPLAHFEVKQAWADGDYVILHVLAKVVAADRGHAIVDIFRFEGGRIVEHWDVTQRIPEHSANTNGMF